MSDDLLNFVQTKIINFIDFLIFDNNYIAFEKFYSVILADIHLNILFYKIF